MISILIATYNAGATLENCLRSILGQKEAEWEILIGDGASEDGTLAIVDRYADRLAYRQSAPDKGPYDAWNQLLSHARGEWVMFLGADDALNDERVLRRLTEECAKVDRRSPQLSYISGITELAAAGRVIERSGTKRFPADRQPLDQDFSFSHTGLLHHRDLFETFGGFDLRFPIVADAHFILRSAKDPRTRFYHADFVVARMAPGGLSTSVHSRIQCYREVEDVRRLLEIKPVRPKWLRALQTRSKIAFHINKVAGEKALLLAANSFRLATGKPIRSSYR